jgi:glycosyltransferase involved in cell wall biosynthesis
MMSQPESTLRILFIHHVGAFGGATKSLVEMLSALPKGALQGVAITPPGGASAALAACGLKIINSRGVPQWDNTRFGHYRGLRWLILLRELSYWPAVWRALRTAEACGPFDLIHCNEITALLPSLLAKRWLRAPLVVHVRSLQRKEDEGWISRWLYRKLRDNADAVIAIDEAVQRTLPATLPATVIHNGLKVPEVPQQVRKSGQALCIGIVGVLHRAKGVYELVQAVRILRDRGVAVHLLVVGENVHRVAGLRGWLFRKLGFARDVRGDLENYVAAYRLGDIVEFTGFVKDISKVYERTDALCFPSHLDAPGRPVFEAALFGLPSIVAMRDPTADVVVDGETGICIDSPEPAAIADAIERLASDRAFTASLGNRARALAMESFPSSRTAAKTWSLYQQVLTNAGRTPANSKT